MSLAGCRVLNTRADHQAAALDALLLEAGALPVRFPCIAIEPLTDTAELDSALDAAAAGTYQWLLITSLNAARIVEARIEALELAEIACSGLRAGAVGVATATAVERWLQRGVEVVPDEQNAGELAAALPLEMGDRVLIPGSSRSRPELADALRARGADVTVVPAYHTVAHHDLARLRQLFAESAFDAMTFASPSAVESFADQWRETGGDLSAITIACIGQTTWQAAHEAGLPNLVVAHEQSLPGLVAALANHS